MCKLLHVDLREDNIILASSSPRRKEILELVGLRFSQVSPCVDEKINACDHKNPSGYVKRIARLKCESVKAAKGSVIVSADTIVYFEKKILGKPLNENEAMEYLNMLSGNSHLVYTGVAVDYKGRLVVDYTKSTVTFKSLSEEEIFEYIKTNEPMDKAGGYGIQGYGAQLVERINGCFFNVMGFPVNLFYRMLCTNKG